MSDSGEAKGKGLPATKVGGMRVAAHHEHNDKAIQPAPQAEAAEGAGEGAAGALIETATEKKEKTLAHRDDLKDLAKFQDPPPRVPEKASKGPRKNQKRGRDIAIIQPTKMN